MFKKILNILQPLIILGLLIYIFFLRGFENNSIKQNNSYQKYKTKEISGKFKSIIKPKAVSSKKKYKTKFNNGTEITTDYEVDSTLLKTYEKAPDSIKTNMFIEQAQIRPYKNDFEDKYIKISMYSKVRGELIEIAPEYNIKSQIDSTKIKQTVFAIYAGGGIYSTPDGTKTGYKINLRFQNKKGDLFSTAYDPINKIIYAEYDMRFLNIKK